MAGKVKTEKQYEVTVIDKVKLTGSTKNDTYERYFTAYAKTPAGAKKIVRDSGPGKIKSVRLVK